MDQPHRNDFKPIKDKMTRLTRSMKEETLKSYEVYLALYQGISGETEARDLFRQFSPGFFDLIFVDECHRGSARDDSAWREVLEYFEPAVQIGMTATPKETTDVSNITYFGDPIYTYSLKQGIDDGFLAPYKVVRIDLDRDLQGWRPTKGMTDDLGQEIKDRTYNQKDMDRELVLPERTKRVAERVIQYLAGTDP